MYAIVNYALNCPIVKTTYFSLLKLLEALYDMPEGILVFSHMQTDNIDYHQEIKSQLLEKMLHCHIEALSKFFESTEAMGTNAFSRRRLQEFMAAEKNPVQI